MRGHMKKSELKNLIQIYSEIKNEIFKKSEIVDLKKGRRVIKINIKPWMYKFPEYLYLIKENERTVCLSNYLAEKNDVLKILEDNNIKILK